jgi:ribosomal protein L29
MDKEEDLKKEIKDLEEKLKDREEALPAHSVRPHQILLIEELETSIEEKKNELTNLRKRKSNS